MLFMSADKDIFRYSEHKNAVFLLGAYRPEKKQLDWILGRNPERSGVMYNVRLNEDIFSIRNGGIKTSRVPEYVIVYNYKDYQNDYHIFPCISSTIKRAADMKASGYPDPKGSYVVYLLGEEIEAESIDIKALLDVENIKSDEKFAPKFIKGSDLIPLARKEVHTNKSNVFRKTRTIRFVDLFAGIGGIRCGLEQACKSIGVEAVCVFTSEIKPYAIKVLQENHPLESVNGDITKIDAKSIPDFDILCAGFPCQAFSSAGKRQGFADTRGTLFFEVERILREKKPTGFILENVEGLVNHDDGNTLKVILNKLRELGYKVEHKVLNSKYFGVAQERKRIYITGSFINTPDLTNFDRRESVLGDVLEHGKKTEQTKFVKNLLRHYTIEELYGKSIKDKRGGNTNIHSWDLGVKGEVSKEEKQLLDKILTERRKKKWAEKIGIDWMDGMPLTLEQIQSFYDDKRLSEYLERLTNLGYLRFEHPKKLVIRITDNGTKVASREYDETKPKGYNIVAGKLSFEINKVLSPKEVAPTLVAMDMQKLYVGDNGGLRRLTLREGLRLCGYPEDYKFNVKEKEGYDLLGNTVVVPVVKDVALRLLKTLNKVVI